MHVYALWHRFCLGKPKYHSSTPDALLRLLPLPTKNMLGDGRCGTASEVVYSAQGRVAWEPIPEPCTSGHIPPLSLHVLPLWEEGGVGWASEGFVDDRPRALGGSKNGPALGLYSLPIALRVQIPKYEVYTQSLKTTIPDTEATDTS